MHSRKIEIGLMLCALMWGASTSAATYSVVSPNGANEIRLMTEPTLSYAVLSGGRTRVEPSAIALEIAGRPALGGSGLRATGTAVADRKGVVPSPIYKKASVDETAKGLVVRFGDWGAELVARDDGVAYRFVTEFPGGEVTVVSERADVAFASKDQVVYAANPEVDVPHLIRYAAERKVGVILWAAWSQFRDRPTIRPGRCATIAAAVIRRIPLRPARPARASIRWP